MIYPYNMGMKKILVIDDDKDICLVLSRFLSKNNYEVKQANRADDGIEILKNEKFDVILCDYKLPDATGIDVLQRITILNPEAAVIIITGYSDVKTAVQTFKHGASDYVTKPLYPDEILLTIKGALEKKSEKIKEATPAKKANAPTRNGNNIIFGDSPQSQTVLRHVDLISPTDMSVIITGETGTGKEYVAKAIHKKSKRKDQPFVAIDCGAIPKDLAGSELFGHMKGAFTGALNEKKGSFELANGGTLFLDEIGNLSYDNQIKLLRVLQERTIRRLGGVHDVPINVRVIVATNENLKLSVKEGHFREDIYHRLNEFSIELSPLRERTPDIMRFAEEFLISSNEQLEKSVLGFDTDVKKKMEEYIWHGNLRELQNVVKRAVLLCTDDYISLKCLPDEIVNAEYYTMTEGNGIPSDSENLKVASENAEKMAILNVLKKTGYNKTKAAQLLKIDRKTLYNKLKAYEINL